MIYLLSAYFFLVIKPFTYLEKLSINALSSFHFFSIFFFINLYTISPIKKIYNFGAFIAKLMIKQRSLLFTAPIPLPHDLSLLNFLVCCSCHTFLYVISSRFYWVISFILLRHLQWESPAPNRKTNLTPATPSSLPCLTTTTSGNLQPVLVPDWPPLMTPCPNYTPLFQSTIYSTRGKTKKNSTKRWRKFSNLSHMKK